jgi:hypothetical protein
MDREIALEDRHSGQFVPARLIERIDVNYARHADDLWRTFEAAEVAQATARGVVLPPQQHSHWRWEKKVTIVGHLLPYPTLAVECNGDPQGLMLLETDGKFAEAPGQSGKPLVYVVFLATAPWNLPTVVKRPRFRGVGTGLMRAAIEVSIDLDFKGRIGLHSLHQSESYYEALGMTALGRDPKKENLNYYEMTPEQATAFLR